MTLLLLRVWREEDASAMVEYALLISLVAIVSWPATNAIVEALGTAYRRWSAAEWGSWQMPPCAAC